MQHAKYMLTFLVLVLFASSAFSQDEMMMLGHKELGVHERPAVEFTHKKHEDIIECKRCHHDFDQNGNNTGSEGQPCSDCHASGAGKNPVPLLDAFHIQCKSCHEAGIASGKASGPIMCGECHVKK